MFRNIFKYNVTQLIASSGIRLRNNVSTLASGKLLLSNHDGVLTFTFNNERAKNATDTEVYDSISAQLKLAENDESVKFVLFTGRGEYYSSGINLKSLSSMLLSNEKELVFNKLIQSIQAFTSALIDFSKPVVAAVNGPAVGIHVATLALKDFVICADTATFLTPFTRIGVATEGCSSLLFPSIFGYSKANSLLMFSQKLTASEALNAGFVSKVISKENFEQEVQHYIYGENGILKSYSYPSILAVKALTKNKEWKRRMHATNEAECEAMAQFWCSSEFEKRVKNFVEKKQRK